MPEGTRKVVFATNIAETSLTIDGIVYVVECGFEKLSECDVKARAGALHLERISQCSALQRAGRAGRTQPGICYFLYHKSTFDTMGTTIKPEIERVSLTSVILNMLALGIIPKTFDFLSKPPEARLNAAIYDLTRMGAIINAELGQLTETGKRIGSERRPFLRSGLLVPCPRLLVVQSDTFAMFVRTGELNHAIAVASLGKGLVRRRRFCVPALPPKHDA